MRGTVRERQRPAEKAEHLLLLLRTGPDTQIRDTISYRAPSTQLNRARVANTAWLSSNLRPLLKSEK
eukprot:COSAG01_NODE_30354_length_617_cov_1.577220_1_plen_66_part_01